MKNLWRKWNFMAQFHFQDPDPDSEYGSNMAIWIRIRNTGTYAPKICPDKKIYLDDFLH